MSEGNNSNSAAAPVARPTSPVYYHQPSGNLIHRVNFITRTGILSTHVTNYARALAQLISAGNPLDYEDLDSKWARLVEEGEGFLGKTVVCDLCEMAHPQELRLREAREILELMETLDGRASQLELLSVRFKLEGLEMSWSRQDSECPEFSESETDEVVSDLSSLRS